MIRLLARGAAPRRAIVGGQGLEAISHTVGRGGHFRHVLTHFGTFEPGSPEQAMEDWVTASGGDPVALVHVLDTFADTSLAALARITVPTLVLTGAEDGHNDTAEALANALGNGRYVMLPGNHGTAIGTPQFEDRDHRLPEGPPARELNQCLGPGPAPPRPGPGNRRGASGQESLWSQICAHVSALEIQMPSACCSTSTPTRCTTWASG